MTPTDFDPYREWLGLESHPLNYYDLLGLPTGESNVERIRTAARRMLCTVRSLQPGRNQDQWKSLLDQLEAARDCLLAADQKARYDQRIRRQIEQAAARAPAKVQPVTTGKSDPPRHAVPLIPPEDDPMAPVEFASELKVLSATLRQSPLPDRLSGVGTIGPQAAEENRAKVDVESAAVKLIENVSFARQAERGVRQSNRRRLRRSLCVTSPAVTYTLLAVCFVAVVAAFVGVMRWRILPAKEMRQRQLASIPQSARDLPLPQNAPHHAAEVSESPSRPNPAASGDRSAADHAISPSASLGSRWADAPATRTDGPRPNTAVRAPLAGAQSAATEPGERSLSELEFAQTDSAELTTKIDAALRQLFVALQNRLWDDARVALNDAQSLAASTPHEDRVERFGTLIDYVHQYHQAFEDGLQDLAGSELIDGKERVMVVDVTANEIVIRRRGENTRYARNELPTELFMAVAERWFNQRATTTPVFRAAYMLVTRPFTLTNVRAAWQAAQQSGAPLGELWPILDDIQALQLVPN